MTISTTFACSPNLVLTHPSGRTYKANSSGIVTVTSPDDAVVGGVAPQAIPLYRTGATSDRPVSGGTGMLMRQGVDSLYYDTSLSAYVWFVGALSSTG